MSNLINTIAIYAIFNRAYSKPVELHEAMQEQGLGCRKDAREFAIRWAGAKFGETPYKGKRGITLVHGSTGYEAAEYVLSVCFPRPGVDGKKKKSGNDKPMTPAKKFLAKVKSSKASGLTYRAALAMLNEAYDM